MCRGRILIVEDDFLIAERIRQIFVQGGYDVVGMAGRTQDAEELAAGHGADLAIVNLKLEADVDGVRTATELQRKHGLKILITTGFSDTSVLNWLGNSMTWPYLRKPFSENELLTAVSACLAGTRPDP